MYDIIVVGAGPAGSSVANITSKNNKRVLVLEKEQFPRYHIGESLIPFAYLPLQQLGVVEQLQNSCFVKKYSVQFIQQDGTELKPFYFYNRYDKNTIAQTWQVNRAEFDSILINQAVSNGAEIKYRARVDNVIYQDDKAIGVVYTDLATNTQHQINAKVIVDASGKSALVGNANKWRVKDDVLSNKMAIWTYYKGCQRDEGIDGGATVVAFIKDKGWFWYIPLANDIVSIGVVAESKYLMRNGISNIKNAFEREVQNNKWVASKLLNANCIKEHQATTDYSKYSTHGSLQNVVLVGDAFAFLDPVFSSGVLLALKSGVKAGKLINKALDENSLNNNTFDEYTNLMNKNLSNMRTLVHAFYNPAISFKEVIQEHPWVADKITDCLSGDLDKDYSDLWDILSS